MRTLPSTFKLRMNRWPNLCSRRTTKGRSTWTKERRAIQLLGTIGVSSRISLKRVLPMYLRRRKRKSRSPPSSKSSKMSKRLLMPSVTTTLNSKTLFSNPILRAPKHSQLTNRCQIRSHKKSKTLRRWNQRPRGSRASSKQRPM